MTTFLSLASVYAQLTNFANLSNFWSLFNTAFGSSYDFATAATFKSQWQSGNFSSFPQIEIVSNSILGTANGAYAISTNKIYLSDQFVSTASQQSLEAVILEEFGHFVDAQLNKTDIAGDEGELFSAVVRGVSLSAAELSRIKAEDDHGIMSLGGQFITIERAAPTILTVATTADQNNGVTTDGLSLREVILIANANPNTDYEIRLTGGLTYNLTANGVNEDAGLTGDLDITSRNNVLYIVSVGTQKATINASNLLNSDRVFDVRTNGRLSLQNVVVTGGLVGDYQNGGGIYVGSTGFLDLYNTTVSNNSSGYYGGGIYNIGTTYLRNGSIISDNSASGIYGDGSGGGISHDGGTLTIMDSSINNNSALREGGGIHNNSTLFVINSTISNNTSSLWGGGIGIRIFSSNSSVSLVNTTVSGNSSSNGGGIYNGGVFNLRNSTITNNTAYYSTQYGGGNGGGISGTANLRNTIVAGNFRPLNYQMDNLIASDLYGTFSGNNNNLIGTLNGASGTIGTGTDIVNANVQLSLLQNNGGLTLTHIPLSGSPAINAGNNNQIPVDSEDLDGDGDTTEQLPFDARNLARISGGIVDIGAVEVQSSVVLPSITLAVAPASVLEDGTPNLIYTFTRTGLTTNTLTVNYGITGTATNSTDYATIGTSVTFVANSATAIVTVNSTADTTIENNETVSLTLATGTGYTIGTTTAVTGTITNDDFPRIALAVTPASVLENGTQNLLYTFTRTGPTTNTLTVNYSITGTADATDYTGSTPGTGKTITFAVNSATATLTIDPTADTTIEANETVALTLAIGTGYTIGTTTAVTGTITNDDVATLPSITLAIAPVSVLEDGTPNLIYTFTRTGPTTNALTVNYGITGTATNGTDYATIGTSVTFVAGSSTATVTANPAADTTIEANETVALNLVTVTGYTIGTTTAVTGTITNDDFPSVTLAVAPASVLEDGTPNLIYTFTRTGPITNVLTVNYGITGTATNGTDYATIGTNITFAANSSTATITVNPTADTIIENNETVALTLATGTVYTLGTTTAVTGIITNDDTAYTAIESVGNTKFLKDGTNKYFAQIGTAPAIAIKYSGTQISKDFFGTAWQTLAVETVNGENQVLWKNVTGNFVHIWKTDSNWNWVSSEGQWALNSNDAFNQETLFGIDANGDGSVGTSVALNLTGTPNNDILIGGANNDVLKGLGGKDILTGGLGSDKFDYKILTDSLLANFDVITDFNANASNDLLVVSTARAGFSNGGAIASLDATVIGNALTNTNFGANFAAQFTFGTRSFVTINDAIAGFSQTTDAIIEITGFTGTLGLTDFVTV